MTVTLDMIGIAAKDLGASLDFYRALGLEVPTRQDGEDHIEAVSGGIRVAWDTIDLIKSFLGEWEEPRGNRLEMAFKCAHRDEVDETYASRARSGIRGLSRAVGRVLGTALCHSCGPRWQSCKPLCLGQTASLVIGLFHLQSSAIT